MDFYVGQVFESKYPPDAAVWCNKNQVVLRKHGSKYVIENIAEPTEEKLFVRLRQERDKKLAETDYVLMPDYPISSENLTKVKAYRQALRDLPSQEGAPWDGGEENTPWPQNPLVESTTLVSD